MRRRQFLGIAGALPAAPAQPSTIEKSGWRLRTDGAGNILSLHNGTTEFVDPALRGNTPWVSGPATLRTGIDLLELPGRGVALAQTITLERSAGSGPVRVHVPRALRLPGAVTTFAPMKNGIARRSAGRPASAYEFAGAHALDRPLHLAIPMISESAADGTRLTCSTDPAFTATFGETIHWVYPESVPLPLHESRTVYSVLHRGDDRTALDTFYSTALRDVPEGPDWLHDIAMVDYDFLSKNGRGWFRDIDVLENMVAKPDRHKVLLALHGWYDFCGRYSFDARTESLDKKWTAFPNAQSPEFQILADRPDNGNPYHWPAASIRSLRPVEMTLGDMHRRIRYAKSRGFRVALYFADGLNACDGIPGFDPSKVLRWGGWTGPETRGKSYAMNPLHPAVPAYFRDYFGALLAEYGREVDAFVWDETFHIQGGDLGAGDYRGFAARAMMQLVKQLTLMAGSHRRGLAFLASDDIGLNARYQAPYALVAHGTYQDSSCAPKGWPYGLIPNFRNTLWSCNWAPMKAFDRTEYAADVFDVPVAISNGYAEDLGVSDMTPGQLRRIAALFERRKDRRMDITWIEERDGSFRYKGRAVREL